MYKKPYKNDSRDLGCTSSGQIFQCSAAPVPVTGTCDSTAAMSGILKRKFEEVDGSSPCSSVRESDDEVSSSESADSGDSVNPSTSNHFPREYRSHNWSGLFGSTVKIIVLVCDFFYLLLLILFCFYHWTKSKTRLRKNERFLRHQWIPLYGGLFDHVNQQSQWKMTFYIITFQRKCPTLAVDGERHV